jgi:plasmid stabilization system protein ParE
VHGVIWSPTAVAQLRAIRAYVAQFNPKAAEELAADLLAVGNAAENFPHRGRFAPGTEMRELTTR